TPKGLFNRGKLFNIGFLTALKENYTCFIFHDCESNPVHFTVAIDYFNYTLPYETYFGGAIGLTEKQFRKANAFSNTYLGWGSEDDDIYERVRLSNTKIFRKLLKIARYASLEHVINTKPPNHTNAIKYLHLRHLYFVVALYKRERERE
ncbi:Beta-1:4-galactosyltransferase 1-like protein, partial [Leptotrombidium deliense]